MRCVVRIEGEKHCRIPFKDNRGRNECTRIYDYIDNRKIIQDYLTSSVLRLVKTDGTEKKSRRGLCPFWEALRRTRCLDMRMTSDEVRLIRRYNRKLNADAMKKRVLYSAVSLGFYARGLNDDNPIQDAFEALLKFNDNDIRNALSYKRKKRLQLNQDELSDVFESDELHRFELLDRETGELYDNYNLDSLDLQEDFRKKRGKGGFSDDS